MIPHGDAVHCSLEPNHTCLSYTHLSSLSDPHSAPISGPTIRKGTVLAGPSDRQLSLNTFIEPTTGATPPTPPFTQRRHCQRQELYHIIYYQLVYRHQKSRKSHHEQYRQSRYLRGTVTPCDTCLNYNRSRGLRHGEFSYPSSLSLNAFTNSIATSIIRSQGANLAHHATIRTSESGRCQSSRQSCRSLIAK